MTAYLLRRLGTSIIVLIGISIFIYLLLHSIYPSPARAVLGLRANNAQINAWNKTNGYDRPVIEQYLSYMNNLIHGNLGYSYSNNQTVASLFQERFTLTWLLSIGIVLMVVVWVLFFAFRNVPYSRELWWQFEFNEKASRAVRATMRD